MKVFISHSSEDKPQVELLAHALRECGFEPWLDKWEIGPGDDIVASINAGLDAANAGIIVFSSHTGSSRWVDAEVNTLTYMRIMDGKLLIPVVVGDAAWVPPLLRPLARRGIDEIDAIIDALRYRQALPSPIRNPEQGRIEPVSISLRETLGEDGNHGITVEVRIGGVVHGTAYHPAIPKALLQARTNFLTCHVTGPGRNPVAAERAAQESGLANLGRQLGAFCFPGSSGHALADLLDGSPVGTLVEVRVEASGSVLLSLPYDALRLPDDRLLATHPACIMLRRPLDLHATPSPTLAGPLKILVAVGAPDEGRTSSAVLDHEREVQNILDAVEPLQRHENAQVRILEVGHPDEIARAIERDAYHVLHLSCHGRPGMLELEDEDGQAVSVTAEELIGPLREKGRPLPLVFLNTCHGAVQDGYTASLAEALLQSGVPAILAMQTSVSDQYASRLARSFYEHLAHGEHLLASRALAQARKDLERERLAAIERHESLHATQPEYATAALFIRGDERPLANFGLDNDPLKLQPVPDVAGPVPQLLIGDLIGRRKELRACLRTLRAESGAFSGVVLTGIGGIGKSALAGRAMKRLRQDGYLVPAHTGRFDLSGIVTALRDELIASVHPWANRILAQFDCSGIDDRDRLRLVARVLDEQRVVLVLDDFEQNLHPGGDAFLNPDIAVSLQFLAEHAHRGRLLITCRNPVPDMRSFLHHIPVGALSPAETRKLALRLDALNRSYSETGLEPEQRSRILRILGGHPRSLEFINTLLGGQQRRLRHMMRRLDTLLKEVGLVPGSTFGDADQALQHTLSIAARDIMLDELLETAREEQIEQVLLQVAVSNLSVTPAGVARMLAIDDAGVPGDVAAPDRALVRLHDMALLHLDPVDRSAWVHRWTAEGLEKLDPANHAERCVRAGRYRMWRVQNESHSLDDAIEAVRNFLSGGDYDRASELANGCLAFLSRNQRSLDVAAFASEVLETLPIEHSGFGSIADQEAQAHLVLGQTDTAFRRYETLVARYERLVQSEPDRADYQRDLSVSYNKMGDLYSALGQGEQARDAFLKSLDIRQRLAQSEPDRADYQRDLSVSLVRVSMVEDSTEKEYLKHALSILESLKSTGRLVPVDEPMITAIQSMISGESAQDQQI